MDPTTRDGSDRGMTSPIGVALLIGITLTASVGIVVIGSAALDGSQEDARIGQSEQALTQLDSRIAEVALGGSSAKSVDLGRGRYDVDDESGSVNITHENWNNANDTAVILPTTELGTITYERDDTTIAYQGGGVWRQDPAGDAQMISPPEFHYRESTLTFPVITVRGEGTRSGTTRSRIADGGTRTVFPNTSARYAGTDSEFGNPVGNGTILTTIESEYCTGWESYFRSRTGGSVDQTCDQGSEDTVVVDLTTPFNENVASGINYNHDCETNGGGNDKGGCEEANEVNNPSASQQIDSRIEECDGGGCDELEHVLGSEIENGTYYAGDDVELNSETFDTEDGNISVVVDGTVDLGDVDVEGDNDVKLFLKDGFNLDGPVNRNDGSASQFQTYVHSDAEENIDAGNAEFTGIIYAPNTDIDVRGNIDITGAVVGDKVTMRGGADINSDGSLDGFETNLREGESIVTFLHVSKNEIDVELS